MPFEQQSHKYQWNPGSGIYSRGNEAKSFHYKLWETLKKISDSTMYNVTVDTNWLNLQEFGKWVDDELSVLKPLPSGNNYGFNFRLFQTQQEPNILLSPETCCLVPKELNGIFKNMLSSSINKSEDNKNLPVGVFRYNYDNSKYSSSITTVDVFNGGGKVRRTLGIFETPELAFYAYKANNEKYIHDLAEYYMMNNYISFRVYQYLSKYELNSPFVDPALYPQLNKQYEAYDKQRSKKVKHPLIVFDQIKFNEGLTFENKYGERYVLDKVYPRENRHYKADADFYIPELNYHYIKNVYLDNVKAGNVKNPYRRLVHNGYFGEGAYNSVKDSHPYKVWEGMMRRSHGLETRVSTYDYTSVVPEWENFQVFTDWYYNYLKSLPNQQNVAKYSFQIDKDIIQWGKKDKIYGPQTCCLIPKELNNILSGFQFDASNATDYRKVKIKNMIDQYLKEGVIHQQIYDIVNNIVK